MTIRSAFRTLILAVAAGFCIGIGGTVSLMQTNKFAGAFLFAVGLLTILIFKLNLFTGMVGYLTDRMAECNWSYLLSLLLVWIGNFLGTGLAAGMLRLTRLGGQATEKCRALAETKLADSWYSLLILGIFCGVLMYIAVDTYKKQIGEKDFLCCVAVFMGVMVFILAGFEHSIADMFYFWLSGRLLEAIPAILIITFGNSVGGNLIPLVLRCFREKERKGGRP